MDPATTSASTGTITGPMPRTHPLCRDCSRGNTDPDGSPTPISHGNPRTKKNKAFSPPSAPLELDVTLRGNTYYGTATVQWPNAPWANLNAFEERQSKGGIPALNYVRV